MNCIFSCQSQTIDVFSQLANSLRRRGKANRCGFFVAHSLYYQRWIATNPAFELENRVVKEWHATQCRTGEIDWDYLKRCEKLLGGSGIFSAIVADRRLFFGPDCTFTADERKRFGDRELWLILQSCLREVELAFDEIKPDCLIGFICVTIFDYLAFLFAKARQVRIVNLRPSRIMDFVIGGTELLDPTPEFLEKYESILNYGSPELPAAKLFLSQFRSERTYYEGTIPASCRPALTAKIGRKWRHMGRMISDYIKYRTTEARQDNHVPDPARVLWYTAMVNPIRARIQDWRLKSHYVNLFDLKRHRYAFYPLHTEPEVSMLVYGRPFLNQVEVIRSLAISLPIDMVLVVKEHPWMVGKRNFETYQRILNIPRVKMISPSVDAIELIRHSSLVTVLASSTGLEAAFLGKPVVTLGHVPYNLLPSTMVKRITDLHMLPATIQELLNSYRSSEPALEAYVASVMELGIRLQWYSVLLRRSFAHNVQKSDVNAEIEKLAIYVENCAKSYPICTLRNRIDGPHLFRPTPPNFVSE